MLTYIALLTALAIPSPRPVAVLTANASSNRPKVEVWTTGGENPYAAGQAVQVLFQTDQDAYVTVIRVDTDGRVRVLFPRAPWEDNFARAGRAYEVQGIASSAGFRADDYPGQGYLFAAATADPFIYDPIASGERWNYELIADGGRIRGDPYAALTELAERIIPAESREWDYDITPYYVEQHYEYPRFLCYDCHTYVSFRAWNPYDYSCVRFRIEVYDDPYYYPYRSYGGTRVVFRRPFRAEPRFIFRDRNGSDAFVTRVRGRPASGVRRRDVGVRGRDIGGRGTVPPPRGTLPPRERPGFRGLRDDGSRAVPHDRTLRPVPRDDRGGFARPDRSPRPANPVRPDRWSRPDRPVRPDYPDRPAGRDRPDRAVRPPPPDRAGERDRPTRREGWGQPGPPRGRERPAPSAEPQRPRQAPRAEPERRGQRDNGGRRGEPELRRRR